MMSHIEMEYAKTLHDLVKAQAKIVRLKAKAHAELAEAVAKERERCAKVCETGVDTEHPTVKGHIMKNFGVSSHLAAAIRKGE